MNTTLTTEPGSSPVATGIRVGLVLRETDLARSQGRLGELATLAQQAGIDNLTVGDHVSFAGGHGVDGLIQATALLVAHPTIMVQTGIFLLTLRHPAIVARQLATMSMLAPGRLSFGVGLGGDDRHELELCGIDPRTRGARMDEALQIVRALMTGEDVVFKGDFFELAGAIRPAVEPPIPVLVGGRSDAAIARAGRHGDGWIGVWVSPARFARAVAAAQLAADEAGRGHQEWQHTMQMWAGMAKTREQGAARVAPVIEASYGLPFERFGRYTPCGGADEIAEYAAGYVRAGCRRFNFVPEAGTLETAIETIGAVKRLLNFSI